MNRRDVLKAASAGAALTFPMVNFGMYPAHAASPTRYSARAARLVEEALVIDMLAPLRFDLTDDLVSRPMTAQEIADFRASGINVFHHAFGFPAGWNQREESLKFIAAWQGFVGRNADLFYLIDKAADLDRANTTGRIAAIIGIQNAEHFDEVKDVKLFHGLGLRSAQLTYNWQNRLGAGCTERVDGGLSDYGAAIVKAMNEVGMLVDISHCGERTMHDANAASAKPVAITHANCRALCEHPRNKSDDIIRAVAKRGGVMGITSLREMVRATEPTNMGHFVDHIDHVVKIAGVEHVGIGSDGSIYGYDRLPPDQYAKLLSYYPPSYAIREKSDIEGFDHPRRSYDLTEELIRRRYSDDNIKLILGGNFRRMLGGIWV